MITTFLLFYACGSVTTTSYTPGSELNPASSDGTQSAPQDYRERGPWAVHQSSQDIPASCSMETFLFEPDGHSELPLVVLGHGFARSAKQLTGWAEHLASWGFTVAVPQLCRSNFWNADHEINGDDMVVIGEVLGASEVVYAGHSAGGLSAFIGAALDPAAIGVIGLDATDADGMGLSYAAQLSVPALGLVAEPSDCNADCNGYDLFSHTADAVAVRVNDTDHCDYESFTDWMCTWFCQNLDAEFADAELHSTIQGLMTAAAFEVSTGPTGWWQQGGFYDALLLEGRITPL